MKNVETDKKRTYPVGLKIETDNKTWYRRDKGKSEHAFKNWVVAPSRGVVVCECLRDDTYKRQQGEGSFAAQCTSSSSHHGTVSMTETRAQWFAARVRILKAVEFQQILEASRARSQGRALVASRAKVFTATNNVNACQEGTVESRWNQSSLFLPSFRWSRFPLYPLTGFSVVLLSLAPEIFVAWR